MNFLDNNLAARCGIFCGECSYRLDFNCPGCIRANSNTFWGKCKISECCSKIGHEHCGECTKFVCEDLHQFAYHKDQVDNGKRIENLNDRKKEGTENWLKMRYKV